MDDPHITPMQQFYKNATIFITGASGCFGKVLLEKLLRSCPDVSRIYILLRPKKDEDTKIRAKQIMDHVLFENLKTDQPNFVDNVVGIDGDCALPNLGLSSENIEIMKREVNIIFHMAAVLNMMGNLKTSAIINIRGTRDIVSLARDMPYLKVFMHVSTAYANCFRSVIEEKIYPPSVDGNAMIMMAENLPDSVLDNILPNLIGEFPNTYSFTKQIAEGVVKETGQDLPIGIHRPSIAASTYREPIKSWINDMQSPTGLLVCVNMGWLSTVPGGRDTKSNIVPLDMCMNSLILAVWDTASLYEHAKLQSKKYEIPVYHYGSNTDNPITWGEIVNKSFFYYKPTTVNSRTARFHFCTYPENVYMYGLYMFLFHFLPAGFLDLIALCSRKSPVYVKMYLKLYKLSYAFLYYSQKDWTFESNNIRRVIGSMSDEDKDIFFCDLRLMNWNDYFSTYMEGIELYLLKDRRKERKRSAYGNHPLIRITIGIALLSMLVLYIVF